MKAGGGQSTDRPLQGNAETSNSDTQNRRVRCPSPAFDCAASFLRLAPRIRIGSLNGTVFSQDRHGLIDRQRFYGMLAAGGGGCAEEGIVDGFFGSFDDGL